VLVGCATVLAWWYTLSPDNNREWRPEVARLPGAQIDGNKITVTNVRNFSYREDEEFDVNWETRSLDLDQLVGVDLFLNFWGPEHIAHTIASWRFADGSHIAVSIETRKESHEEYSATKGFFRQFEIYYVVADERDLIKVRTDHRGEDVYLYRMGFPLEDAKALLLDYMREINRLNQQPRWYNALTHNCTTAIRYHSKHIGAAGPLDWRLFANGHPTSAACSTSRYRWNNSSKPATSATGQKRYPPTPTSPTQSGRDYRVSLDNHDHVNAYNGDSILINESFPHPSRHPRTHPVIPAPIPSSPHPSRHPRTHPVIPAKAGILCGLEVVFDRSPLSRG
jgi:hypothetical protein